MLSFADLEPIFFQSIVHMKTTAQWLDMGHHTCNTL